MATISVIANPYYNNLRIAELFSISKTNYYLPYPFLLFPELWMFHRCRINLSNSERSSEKRFVLPRLRFAYPGLST